MKVAKGYNARTVANATTSISSSGEIKCDVSHDIILNIITISYAPTRLHRKAMCTAEGQANMHAMILVS